MESIIFYSHPKPLNTNAYRYMGGVWVRYETKKNLTPLEALDQAQPRPGETVLNTVEIPE